MLLMRAAASVGVMACGGCKPVAIRASQLASSFSFRLRVCALSLGGVRPLSTAAFNGLPRHFNGSAPSIVQQAADKWKMKAHGKTGQLVNVMLQGAELSAALSECTRLPEYVLSKRQICDLEMIMNGGFTPLSGFMNQNTYKSVGVGVCLKDEEGNPLAILHVDDVYTPDKLQEAQQVFGGDQEHPAIHYLFHSAGATYVGGRIHGLQLPPHYDHNDIRKTPVEVRAEFSALGWSNVVAFQTRNPLHRAHFELTVRAAAENNAALLLHPVVGMTKPGDIEHHVRVKCYRAIMNKYQPNTALLTALPLAMRMAGPREALWHALIRQNYGCTHFILGRDHAGPGANSKGKDFYGPFEARDFALKYQKELAIRLVPFDMMVYLPQENRYVGEAEVQKGTKVEKLSGTEVRRRLNTGAEIPEWFSFPEVVRILRTAHPPRHQQGFCVFFTGLSGSGKSTVANALVERLMSIDSRFVTLLDGDLVRKMLSSELGFSQEHRNLNIQRIGYVSSLIVGSGGCVIAAPIAPYAASRAEARKMCQARGGFFLVHMSASVDVCETRDRKGLYAKVRQGLLKNFTGVDDPYQIPQDADISIDSKQVSVSDAVDLILRRLQEEGFVKSQ